MNRYNYKKCVNINTIKGISSITIYNINNQEYFFFGEKNKSQTHCDLHCDTQLQIYGGSCTTFNTLLYNWLIYNNNFGAKTLLNLDVNEELPFLNNLLNQNIHIHYT